MKNATKKTKPAVKKKSVAKKKAAPPIRFLVPCCSAALDLVFADVTTTAQLGETSVGSHVRLQSGSGTIGIVGLDPNAVNKLVNPWQITVSKMIDPNAVRAQAKKKK